MRVLEEENLDRLIDDALESRNEALFHDLMAEKARLTGGYAASSALKRLFSPRTQ